MESSSGEMSHSFGEGSDVCTQSSCCSTVMCLFQSVSFFWHYCYYLHSETKELPSAISRLFWKADTGAARLLLLWHGTRRHFPWNFLPKKNTTRSITVGSHFLSFWAQIKETVLLLEATHFSSLLFQTNREKDLEVTRRGRLKYCHDVQQNKTFHSPWYCLYIFICAFASLSCFLFSTWKTMIMVRKR